MTTKRAVLLVSIAVACSAIALAVTAQLRLDAEYEMRGLRGFTELPYGIGDPSHVRTPSSNPWLGGIGFAAALLAALLTAGRSMRVALVPAVAFATMSIAFGVYGQQNEAVARNWEDVRRCAEEDQGLNCIQQGARASSIYKARPDPLPLFAGLSVIGLTGIEVFGSAGLVGYVVVSGARRLTRRAVRSARS